MVGESRAFDVLYTSAVHFLTEMNLNGCEHLANLKASEGVQPYRVIHAYFVVCSAPGSRKYKAYQFFCHECGKSLPRLHSCMHCVFFGCIEHIEEHATKLNHYLSVDLTFGHVLCTECGDYVYDSELEEIARGNELSALQTKNRSLKWARWDPSPTEQELLRYHCKRVCITPQSTIGLRGLLNLGSTCFMNCIVQALMHTPLLRDYFLAERHSCNVPTGSCLVCELSRLFQEFYKGARGPLALHHLLHLIWTNDKNLAGYEQKDAHEFFLATLDVLHRHCVGAMPPLEMPPGKPYRCACIIDQIFTGGLQSDVVCQKCKGVSTTIDPISVISLDLACSQLGSTPPSSLGDCLDRYTRAEHLGSGSKILCSKCESYQESTKQLTVKTLPVVVSFHLKRFERSKNIDKKISAFISFPEMLDMTPYMSQSTVTDSNLATDNRYSLFAVINHRGHKINAGHYIAYVRQQREYWYKCDDDVITRANLQEVLESEGYLLFYHKHILEYE